MQASEASASAHAACAVGEPGTCRALWSLHVSTPESRLVASAAKQLTPKTPSAHLH